MMSRIRCRFTDLQHSVAIQDRVKKMPANWERRQERAEWKLNDIRRRKECQEQGLDYDRHKLLHVSASDADRKDNAKKAKKNTDPGFSSESICRLI